MRINNTSNFISSYFNSVNSANSFGSGMSFLSDYASIRNGSYKKLLKAYYAKQDNTNSSSSSNKTDKTDSTDTKDKTKVSTAKSAATKLSSTAKSLYTDSSLFQKKDIETTDENGKKTTTKDYDRDAIYKKVNEFVDSYNSMVKSADNASNASVTSATRNMTNQTAVYKKMLSKVGVTINSDNTLSIDKNAFQKADMSDVKTLFSGTNSFAHQTSTKASSIANYASGYLSSSSLYTNRATTYMDNTYNSFLNGYF